MPTYQDPRHALYDMSRVIVNSGDAVSPRGIQTRELLYVTMHILDTAACLPTGMNRRLNSGLAAAEALSILSGIASKRLMNAATPRYTEFTGGELTGAYGPRLARQLPCIVEMLRADRNTRQAVAMIWNPDSDLFQMHGDRPCTTEIRFLIRGGELIMNTMMRSQDIYLGFPYDLIMFSMVHQTMAYVLGVPPGYLVHQVQSLHAYERDIEAIRRLIPPKEPNILLTGLRYDEWQVAASRAADIMALNVDPTDVGDSPTECWLYNQMFKVHKKIEVSAP